MRSKDAPSSSASFAEAAGRAYSGAIILGLETSCDETAGAVVRGGHEVLSNVVASQIETHSVYGGVVPELASREHLRNLLPVVRRALSEANVSLAQLDAIAVTEGPGLAGALMVGISFAKALAFSLDKPLLAVNHLAGHIHTALLAEKELALPALALVVSGGHTHLYAVEGQSGQPSYRNVGRTVDDAAGEAFDKVAKMLGLPYPGGPWIDQLACFGDPAAVKFSFAQIKEKAHLEKREQNRFDFSFSGIKTAVLRAIELQGLHPGIERRRAALLEQPPTIELLQSLCDLPTLNLIASFQSSVVGDLLRKTFAAARSLSVRTILITGGVAANGELRRRFRSEAATQGLDIRFPGAGLSTDNAVMIAAAGYPKLLAGEFADAAMTAEPGLSLGDAAGDAAGSRA